MAPSRNVTLAEKTNLALRQALKSWSVGRRSRRPNKPNENSRLDTYTRSSASIGMNLEQAKAAAQKKANETDSPVIVYQSKLNPDRYGIEFTLPLFATNVEKVWPEGTKFIDIKSTDIYFPS
jgi:hypothetical protein